MKKTVSIKKSAFVRSMEECDLSFVPPMTRRRLSPLQKIVFFLLEKVVPKEESPEIIFASRRGEVGLTHEIVESFNAGDGVSPWKFSSSVYNAAVGLYSVFTKNRSSYTAVAAGGETVENSLIEAVFGNGRAVWCYAEEDGGGYGAAAEFAPAGDNEVAVEEGDPSAAALGFEDVVAFLSGDVRVISGKRISLRWVRR